MHLLAPTDAENDWRDRDLDSLTLSRMSTADLLKLLVDLSPDISRAFWDLLRMANPGLECRALRPDGNPDERATATLDGFFDTLRELYGSADVVLNRLFAGCFLRGAFFAELILDDAGRTPLDLATPDPRWVRFRRFVDPQRGETWQPYQQQGSQPVPLDSPTVRYVPLDPLPGSPYGRSMAAPGPVPTAIFALGLLHDLRRVVAQQGWPRIDLTIKLEELMKAMPETKSGDPTELRAWVSSIVSTVQDEYNRLEPDDAYVHTDVVEVGAPKGAVDSKSLGAVDGIMHALERQIIRALKTMPLLFGVNEGASETHANRQWEVHVAGIKSLQHLCESLLEHLLTVALQAQGIQANVEFRFSELRAAELLRDAQVERAVTEVAALQKAFRVANRMKPVRRRRARTLPPCQSP